MSDKSVVITSGSELRLIGDEIPFGAYQAVYHKLTKRTETRRKTYADAYRISFGDINNLNSRLEQVIQQYAVKSKRCQVVHRLHEQGSTESSSFDQFRLRDQTTRCPTSLVSYEFDFLVILPAEVPEASEIAQRNNVKVIIDQPVEQDNNDPFGFFCTSRLYAK